MTGAILSDGRDLRQSVGTFGARSVHTDRCADISSKTQIGSSGPDSSADAELVALSVLHHREVPGVVTGVPHAAALSALELADEAIPLPPPVGVVRS